MNKRSVRSLGIGFLLSGVLVGAYNFFNPNGTQSVDNSDSEVLASLETENNDLKSENTSLNDEIAVLKESSADNQSNTQSESGSQTSQESNSDESNGTSDGENPEQSDNEEQANQDSENNENVETTENGLAAPDEAGTFTIAEGSSTSEIAQQLEEAGYIASADDFTSLIEEWGLETVIVADEYSLNSDMSIHDIANIITQGAYYYY
ncbi:endolytic transglycosylase MltG [Aerococcaceae bacterium DSM 111020]|nr:endolytic transglycosylase MltG [Aerococcaceae bacterium DSM 111020]